MGPQPLGQDPCHPWGDPRCARGLAQPKQAQQTASGGFIGESVAAKRGTSSRNVRSSGKRVWQLPRFSSQSASHRLGPHRQRSLAALLTLGSGQRHLHGRVARVAAHPRSFFPCPSGALRAEALRACPHSRFLSPSAQSLAYMYLVNDSCTHVHLQSALAKPSPKMMQPPQPFYLQCCGCNIFLGT